MNILVFDTCLDKMYVTLAKDEKIISSKIVKNRDNKYHSAFLISTIKEVLKENNMAPQDIELVGTNIGPGSFTGIRACTTVARMMAQQLNINAIGLSSLEIISQINDTNKKTMVALDARKGCAYLRYDEEIKGAVKIEEVKELISNDDYFLITDDKLQPELGGISYQNGDYKLGDILARLVYNKSKIEDLSWQNLKPLYIQPPGVNLNIK